MRRRILFPLMFLAALWPSSAATVSLLQLVRNTGTPDGTLAIGDKVFSDFTFSIDPESKAVSSQFIVLTTSEEPNNPGFRIQSNELQVGPGEQLSINIGFTVDDGGRNTIEDASMAMTSYDIARFADVEIDESFSNDNGLVATYVDLRGNSSQTESEHTFMQPVSNTTVETNIRMSADELGGSVNLRTFTENFSEVPEPGSDALCLIGVGAIAALLRRRKTRSGGRQAGVLNT